MNDSPPIPPSSSASRPYDPDYWIRRFSSEPYLAEGDRFEDFEPVYRFGHSLHGLVDDFDLQEAECEIRWNHAKADSKLSWDKAKAAARAAWKRAGVVGESKFQEALHRVEDGVRAAAHRVEETLREAGRHLQERAEEGVARLKKNVRRSPGEYVLGALGTGYVAGRIPLRTLALSGVGLAAAVAPMAILFWGVYKAADHFLGPGTRAATFPGSLGARKEGEEPSIVLSDE